jgi:predicted tellurium resistance membrane protein TerC
MKRWWWSGGVFVGLLAMISGAGTGGAAATAPEGNLRVRAIFVDGGQEEAEWLAGPIRLHSPIGLLEVRDREVLRVTLAQQLGSDAGRDVVQLRDRTIWRGHVEGERFAVRSADGPTEWPRSQLQEVRFMQPGASTWGAWLLGLLTLTLMEVVLGVDNIVFLAIVVGKLPAAQQPIARRVGLAAALATRIVLLLFLSVLLGLTKPLVQLPALPFLHDPEALAISGRDLILLVGGLFLIIKSVWEIHSKLESGRGATSGHQVRAARSLLGALLSIAVIDIVFSLDSVITAVGMVEQIGVMIAAMVLAMVVMLVGSGPLSAFVHRHPSVQVLALSFLILIGVLLVAEGMGQHLDKGYIYFAMAFAVVVELMNLRWRWRSEAQASVGAAAVGG